MKLLCGLVACLLIAFQFGEAQNQDNALNTPSHLDPISGPNPDMFFEGDILVSPERMRSLIESARQPRGRGRRQARARQTELWPAKTLFYAFANNASDFIRKQISDAIFYLENTTCLRFQSSDRTAHHILISNFGGSCFSELGRDAAANKEYQRLSLDPSCGTPGTSIHELMHAAGIQHQHARCDYGSHINITRGNIPINMTHNYPVNTCWEETRGNVKLPYDVASIMHYYEDGVIISLLDKNLGELIGNRGEPTFGDILHINTLYNCSEHCHHQMPCENGGYTDPKDCSVCRCPLGYAGPLCKHMQASNMPGCGETYLVNSTKQSINIELPMSSESSTCINFFYATDTQPDTIIQVSNVRGLDDCELGCTKSFVEIKYAEDPRQTGARFCCGPYAAPKVIRSTRHLMPMIVTGPPNVRVTLTYYSINK